MVANNVIQSVLDTINKANPNICKVKSYKSIYPSKYNDLDLSIYNNKSDFFNVTLTKKDINMFYLHIASSTGINFLGNIKELEYLNIQSAILMCLNRFNETIEAFCDKFYD